MADVTGDLDDTVDGGEDVIVPEDSELTERGYGPMGFVEPFVETLNFDDAVLKLSERFAQEAIARGYGLGELLVRPREVLTREILIADLSKDEIDTLSILLILSRNRQNEDHFEKFFKRPGVSSFITKIHARFIEKACYVDYAGRKTTLTKVLWNKELSEYPFYVTERGTLISLFFIFFLNHDDLAMHT